MESARRKRTKCSVAGTTPQFVHPDAAREEARKILAVVEDDLVNPEKSTALPYPGLGTAPSRPPVAFTYVGRTTLEDLLEKWYEGAEKLLVYGPKGVGKSSDFRAMACLLFKNFHMESDNKCRFVFLWVETVLVDMVQAVKDALFFSFMVDEAKSLDGWKQAQAAIDNIKSVDDAISFIRERKQIETFAFLVDGGEKLDPVDILGRPTFDSENVAAVATNMQRLLATAKQVWWCLSVKAKLRTRLRLPWIVYVDTFNQEEYSKYAANCILGKLPECRLSSIKYYTGFVPLFLDALCASCDIVVREVLKQEEGLFEGKPLFERIRLRRALNASDSAMVDILDEDDNWDAVLRTFAQHDEVLEVKKKAEEIQLQGKCQWDADMARADPTYVLDAEKGEYCSDYVKDIYLRAVRSKEDKSSTPHA